MKALLRGTHDVSTAQGRARERYRLATLATLANVAARGLAMLLIVLGVRLTAGYLGTTRFGVWATFASLTAMLSLLDLGIGNALVNRVAHASADDDPNAVKRIATGGAGLLAMIGLAASAVLLLAAQFLPWGALLKLADPALAEEARLAAIVFAVLFGVNLFGSGMLRILVGQQRLHEASLLSAGATGLACLALFLAAGANASVPWLLGATFGVQTLAGLTAGALLWHRGQISLREGRSAMADERRHLLRVGSLFVLLQLGTMLGWGADSMILATIRGASEVAVYAVAARLFQFASQPFAILNAPLWAAYADAVARRDDAFIRHTLRRSFLITVFGTAALAGALALAGPMLIAAWTHGTVVVPMQVLLLFAVWTVFEAGGNAFGVYLNGTGIVREQVWVVTAFCAVALPLKLLGASQWGAAGLLTAGIVAYSVAIIGPYATVFRNRVLAPITGQKS